MAINRILTKRNERAKEAIESAPAEHKSLFCFICENGFLEDNICTFAICEGDDGENGGWLKLLAEISAEKCCHESFLLAKITRV